MTSVGKQAWTYDDFLGSLKRGEISPVYLFHGEEDFLAEEATDQLVEKVLSGPEREFNLDVVYGNEADARDIVAKASSFPMMAARRVVVVKGFDKLPNKELLTPYLERPSETTCLILLAQSADMRKKPYVTVKGQGRVLEFKPLYDDKIPGWIAGRGVRIGKTILPEAARMLSLYAGPSLREIQGELDKLSIFVGEKKEIGADDVSTVVGVSREFNVFELQRVLGDGNAERTLFVLERMLDAGESAIKMIIMLTRYFTILWKLQGMHGQGVPQSQMASASGIHPRFLGEHVRAAHHFPEDAIGEIFVDLSIADEQLKISQDPHNVMIGLFVRILGRWAGVKGVAA